MMDRQDVIAHYRAHPQIDVLIVGAGINGIGTFRDLTLQGVNALLVDKGDFCSGASAASTRFAHGGIRYLENGEFRLVRESLAERNRLLQNAPHAVHPQLFTIPVYSLFSGILNAPLKFLGLLKRPSERGAVVIKAGMMLYDWFTRKSRMTGTHRLLSRKEALRRHPHLNPDIRFAATYYDAVMPYAERIGLELVLDAEAESPQTHALNYVSLVDGAGDTVTLRDEVTGAMFEVKPTLMVNASGAWIDFVNRSIRHETRYIGGTKGSHIIIDHPALYKTLNGSTLFFENKDGRMCLFAPFKGKVLIGATDIRIEDPEQAVCSDDEIDYFFGFTAQVLPDLTLDRSQIVYHFCGVRPLPNTDVEFAGLISRDHSIQVIEPDERLHFPVYSLVGGKWTTFRAFAEQVTDRLLAALGKPRHTKTDALPIGGGRGYPADVQARDRWIEQAARETGLARARVETLFERYGTRARDIAAFIAQAPDAPLHGQADYSEREILYIATYEKVAHLDDVLLRRSLLAMLGLVDGALLQQVGALVGRALGWTSAQIEAEIERCSQHLQRKHGVAAARLHLPDTPARA